MRLAALCLVVGLALLPRAGAQAQERARRLVAAGEVTGLEMSIDGALHAPPGGHVRWLVTTYEVLRRRDLRVAGGIQLTVTASFADGPALMTTTSDADGHAVLELALPDDLEGGTTMSVEAISPRGIRRTFDAPIALDARTLVELVADRSFTSPGGSVAMLGRVLDTRDGRPRAAQEVSLTVRGDGTLLRAPLVLTTDASGLFATEVALPERPGSFVVAAATEDASQSTTVDVRPDAASTLWARAEPTRRVVRPGETVPVDVLVRGEDGAPVPGARVAWSDAPPPDDDDQIVRTDASGHASLTWEIDRFAAPDESFEDRERALRIVHAAHGTTSAAARVRIARPALFVTWSVDGGALVAGLGSRIFVRATAPDGAPRAGVAVALEAGALGPARTTTTDADGVAALDVTLAATHADANGCGGPTAVMAALTVDGALREACLPIEPDALLTVRAARVASALEITLARRPEASGRPVSLVLLAREGDAWEPLARAVISGRASSATLALPPLGAVPLWVRARVVVDGQELVGGGTVIFSALGPPIAAFRASAEGAHVEGATSVALLGLDAPLAPAFEARVDALTTPLGGAVARGRSALYVAAMAGVMVPRDTAAAGVLREGAVAPLSMPDDAVSQGLLRDPWRTRARFVRGRLGAMMRAVESLVDQRVPDAIDQVGVLEHGAWRFDREMLEAALAEAGLGDERAAALDGEPLDIAALTALDPSFTYDHVARRITRERLFRMLWFLRQLVRERQLDLAWARRGDPAEYPVSLLDSDIGWQDEYPERAHLFDAWGHPFVLVPVRGHPRFDRFQPVPGYELVSGGPDGRVGDADDVFDPFARVLASGSVYAEAVQEDELVARLGSVELGRATVETLAEAFAYSPAVEYDVSVASAVLSWGREPTPLAATPAPLAPLPTVARTLFGSGVGAATDVAWTPPLERRAYVAYALAFDPSGAISARALPFEAGSPIIAHVDTPALLRVGDALRVPIRLVQLTGGTLAPPTVQATASGVALRAHVEGTELLVEGVRPGTSSVELVVRAGDAPVYRLSTSLRVLPTGALRAAHVGAMGASALGLELPVPAGASAWRSRWVIGAPTALRRDPLFAEGPGHDAALSAWADVLAGATPAADDMAALERAVSSAPAGLHTACALVAWASAGDPDHDPHFWAASRSLADRLPSELASRAAMLAALAPTAPAMGDTSAGIPAVVAELREDAWRALATERDHPATLAAMAAALLLVDRDDAVARALFERARAAASPTEGFDDATAQGLAGTFALIIAARQIDQDALADALADRVLARLYLAPRLGVETEFWALAASSFGALGAGTSATATVEVDGTPREVSLVSGAAVLDDVRAGAAVRVTVPGRMWARGELRAIAPYQREDALAVDPRIEGEVGLLGERAALELVLESTGDEELSSPIVEIALPSGALLDPSARASIAGAAAVQSVEGPDGAGVLRLRLAALRARGTYRVPLPLRWRASGVSHGLGVVVYDRAAPWAMTMREEREIEVRTP